jgi:hypothetical protein
MNAIVLAVRSDMSCQCGLCASPRSRSCGTERTRDPSGDASPTVGTPPSGADRGSAGPTPRRARRISDRRLAHADRLDDLPLRHPGSNGLTDRQLVVAVSAASRPLLTNTQVNITIDYRRGGRDAGSAATRSAGRLHPRNRATAPLRPRRARAVGNGCELHRPLGCHRRCEGGRHLAAS